MKSDDLDKLQVNIIKVSSDYAVLEKGVREYSSQKEELQSLIQHCSSSLEFCRNGAKIVNLDTYRKYTKEITEAKKAYTAAEAKEKEFLDKLAVADKMLGMLNERLAAMRKSAPQGKVIHHDFGRDKGTNSPR